MVGICGVLDHAACRSRCWVLNFCFSRVRLSCTQVMGFGWMCVLFAACGAYYDKLTQPRLIDVFRLLYYASRCGCCIQAPRCSRK